MNADRIRSIKAVFNKYGYDRFTNATDAVRIKGPGRIGERLAVHQERGTYTLYVRLGGKGQVAQIACQVGGILEGAVVAFRNLDLAGVQGALTKVVTWLDGRAAEGGMTSIGTGEHQQPATHRREQTSPRVPGHAPRQAGKYIQPSWDHLPCTEVREILIEALAPCPHFSGTCHACCRWDPASGHIPRGFLGATGSPHEVRLVMVLAEPGDPHDEEAYDPSQSKEELLAAFCTHSFACFRDGHDPFHRNQKEVIDQCFPGMSLEQQLRSVWMVDAMLCSAPKEGGHVPARVWRTCAETYLKRQLALFPQAVVAAFGHKASTRLRDFTDAVHAKALAPPGCNFAGVRESWYDVVRHVRASK